eukprot:s243_g6.t1
MPTVSVFFDSLQKALGNDVTEESFDELCFEFGLELDDVTSQKAMVEKERGAQAAEGLSDRVIFKVDGEWPQTGTALRVLCTVDLPSGAAFWLLSLLGSSLDLDFSLPCSGIVLDFPISFCLDFPLGLLRGALHPRDLPGTWMSTTSSTEQDVVELSIAIGNLQISVCGPASSAADFVRQVADNPLASQSVSAGGSPRSGPGPSSLHFESPTRASQASSTGLFSFVSCFLVGHCKFETAWIKFVSTPASHSSVDSWVLGSCSPGRTCQLTKFDTNH